MIFSMSLPCFFDARDQRRVLLRRPPGAPLPLRLSWVPDVAGSITVCGLFFAETNEGTNKAVKDVWQANFCGKRITSVIYPP